MTDNTEAKTVRHTTLMTPDEYKAIRTWMFDTRLTTSMSEAVRELIKRGLKFKDAPNAKN